MVKNLKGGVKLMDRRYEDGQAEAHHMNKDAGEAKIPVAAGYGSPIYEDMYEDPKFARPGGVDLYKRISPYGVEVHQTPAEVEANEAQTGSQGS